MYILYKRSTNGSVWYLETYIHDELVFTNDINKALKLGYHRVDWLQRTYLAICNLKIARYEHVKQYTPERKSNEQGTTETKG